MQARDIWRTTTFRLSAFYGVLFALGTAALLGLVYLQSASYLNRRVDHILLTEVGVLMRAPLRELPDRIQQAVALNNGQTNVFAAFTSDHRRLVGNLRAWPQALRVDGPSAEVPPTRDFPAYARLKARQLPSGEIVVVGRDVQLARELRVIIRSALVWSGASIIVMGSAFAVALSLSPIRRLHLMRLAAEQISAGDLRRRMPISRRRDELDMIAGTVNAMIVEVERLMTEVKAATDTIAHDLRTPLTRARAQLHRVSQEGAADPRALRRITAEIDEVLERFRALLRLSELEARERRAAYSLVPLVAIAVQAVELYRPLADEGGIELAALIETEAEAEADAKLLFEALSNLVDNALKFTPRGGIVRVCVRQEARGPCVVVEDNGPGIPETEWASVLRRFYRTHHNRMVPGSGLGLSVVAAIVRLHGFSLELQDAQPGLRVVLICRPKEGVATH